MIKSIKEINPINHILNIFNLTKTNFFNANSINKSTLNIKSKLALEFLQPLGEFYKVKLIDILTTNFSHKQLTLIFFSANVSILLNNNLTKNFIKQLLTVH